MYSPNKPCEAKTWSCHTLPDRILILVLICSFSKSLKLYTYRENRQGDLFPEFVLLRDIFSLCPMGGVDEPVHQEGYDDLCHLVHQLAHYQQRCQTLHTDTEIMCVISVGLYGHSTSLFISFTHIFLVTFQVCAHYERGIPPILHLKISSLIMITAVARLSASESPPTSHICSAIQKGLVKAWDPHLPT